MKKKEDLCFVNAPEDWQHDALIVGASRTPWFVQIASAILAKRSVPQGMVTSGEVVFLRPHCETWHQTDSHDLDSLTRKRWRVMRGKATDLSPGVGDGQQLGLQNSKALRTHAADGIAVGALTNTKGGGGAERAPVDKK